MPQHEGLVRQHSQPAFSGTPKLDIYFIIDGLLCKGVRRSWPSAARKATEDGVFDVDIPCRGRETVLPFKKKPYKYVHIHDMAVGKRDAFV